MSMLNYQPGQTVRVIKAYQTPFPDPLIIKAGQKLDLSDRASDWPGWLWCTTLAGQSGWVPAAYIEPMGQLGLARRDYDATELSAQVGEELTVSYEESDWLWCTNQQGRRGWIPAENVAGI